MNFFVGFSGSQGFQLSRSMRSSCASGLPWYSFGPNEFFAVIALIVYSPKFSGVNAKLAREVRELPPIR